MSQPMWMEYEEYQGRVTLVLCWDFLIPQRNYFHNYGTGELVTFQDRAEALAWVQERHPNLAITLEEDGV